MIFAVFVIDHRTVLPIARLPAPLSYFIPARVAGYAGASNFIKLPKISPFTGEMLIDELISDQLPKTTEKQTPNANVGS